MALPGETLVYTITYSNQSSEALGEIIIFDSTPAFTTFVSAGNGALPASLLGVAVSVPAAGQAGVVRWTFTGTLNPGSKGAVTYSVMVTD